MTRTLYDRLLERAHSAEPVQRLLLGLNWSVAQVETCGLCFSPPEPPRTLDWPGTIAGRAASELVSWIRSPELAEATVALTVINALLNQPHNDCLKHARPLEELAPPHLAVFASFKEQVRGAKVVVVGRYPGLEAIWDPRDYSCLERRPLPGTLPERVAPETLAAADWVFITASSLANQSLPQLLQWSHGARVVLMGPSTPWLAEWADFGVHYLAGVEVLEPEELFRIAAEGGGTRIFERAVRYKLLDLNRA
ncbi:MAG TPA: DUF364 domain-containing protein [Polyangiaceae bacterium]|nr:DUF364 domain-containing protein [Polyangiaceae bacterium]